ncbi:TonB-dependent receptor plug domain-containing protein [Maribacter sp. X9]|uniref:TonB-dependent receptor plug domain-containing protein n=1 Tax=Maribacter sp. X9 TaxID=3402159 RepID=UPI003AF3E71A
MKYRILLIAVLLINTLSFSCSSSKQTTTSHSNFKEELDEKNRTNLSLLDRLVQLPGIIKRNGVPVFTKSSGSFGSSETQQPLYILDGYEIGNSFSSLNEAVKSFNVKKIIVLSSADAGMYGTRAANGVIVITTYK